MSGPRLRGPAVAALCLMAPLLGAASARAAIPGPGSPATRAPVQDVVPLPRDASRRGALAPGTAVRVTVTLTPRTGLAAYAAAVSDPHSPHYRDFLTVAQFAARFGARPAAAATVRRTLRRSGLQVGRLSADGLSLPVRGTAAKVEGAFTTRLERVALPHRRSAYADLEAPTLPAAAAGTVQGVIGLDSLPIAHPEGLVRARSGTAPDRDLAAAAHGPSPCLAAQAAGDTAQEIASAYGLDGLWDAGDVGAGTTVALLELEPFSATDVAAYQACYGTDATVQTTPVDGFTSTGAGSGEAALDIEDVIGLAPGATVHVYEGPNTAQGSYETYQAMITARSAKVISTSWGECEAAAGATARNEENTLFEEAATYGETVYAAAGDSGAADCGTHAPAVDDPASQPDVTGVGGTSLADYLEPADETVWNDASTGHGAGGGGVSAVWSVPSYQSALTGATKREVPDVSADADPNTGYAIYYKNAWGEFGGTSAAAPTWAALTALAEASSYCAGRSLGLINAALYGHASDFYDVTSGNNGYDGVTGYSAGPGYDMASGLGAPDGATLVPALCGAPAGTAVSEPGVASASSTDAPTTTTVTAGTPTPTGTPTTTTTTTAAAPPAPPISTSRRHPRPATVVFIGPARRRDRLGARVHVALRARDRAGLRLRYSAHGLPPGLRIDRATGAVTGRARRPGAFRASVSAVDTAGNASSVVIRWTIAGRGSRRARAARKRPRSE